MSKKKSGILKKLLGYETIKQGVGVTSSMLKELKPSKKEYIKETFEEALKRNGIVKSQENDHLQKVYKNQKIQSIITLLGSVFIFALGVSRLRFVDGFIDLLGATSYFTISIAIFIIFMTYSFRAFQIRYKRLGMLSYWFKNIKEWYPRKITIQDLELIDKKQQENKDFLKMNIEEYIEYIKGNESKKDGLNE